MVHSRNSVTHLEAIVSRGIVRYIAPLRLIASPSNFTSEIGGEISFGWPQSGNRFRFRFVFVSCVRACEAVWACEWGVPSLCAWTLARDFAFSYLLLYVWVLRLFLQEHAICMGFKEQVEIFVLYAWFLWFRSAGMRDLYAICMGLKVKVEICMLYAWALRLWMSCSCDLDAICMGFKE